MADAEIPLLDEEKSFSGVLRSFATALPIAVIFPFLYFMVSIDLSVSCYFCRLEKVSSLQVQDFHVTKSDADIGYFAGWIGSCCKLPDPFLLIDFSSSIVFNTLFGLSKSFWMALTTRFLLGTFNGLLGTMTVGSMWGVGLILGPALGGYLSQVRNIFQMKLRGAKRKLQLPIFPPSSGYYHLCGDGVPAEKLSIDIFHFSVLHLGVPRHCVFGDILPVGSESQTHGWSRLDEYRRWTSARSLGSSAAVLSACYISITYQVIWSHSPNARRNRIVNTTTGLAAVSNKPRRYVAASCCDCNSHTQVLPWLGGLNRGLPPSQQFRCESTARSCEWSFPERRFPLQSIGTSGRRLSFCVCANSPPCINTSWRPAFVLLPGRNRLHLSPLNLSTIFATIDQQANHRRRFLIEDINDIVSVY
ncbi:uncharacterized protein LOC112342559 [Selaginella moellendorffii]|uniref:uncharacterized protein LOC112342559 n=1 Tax=Selaginella moellendorffii TaxID=88036 RepID=UPI000D1C75D0|nr:uncharacterized protein LOC112342559 [Selaginella moellendorffii]|eukprot:XP_024520359.1 uncharacterized protein LOC112342559 [Selaginella moellendorffii]